MFRVRQQGEKGKWDFRLSRTYTICILDFCFDDTHPNQVVHRVKLIEEESYKVFNDRLMYWYIELPKFNKQEHELINREDIWLYVLRNLTEFSEIPLFLQDDPVFKDFFMDARKAHLMERELQAYYASLKDKWERFAVEETARMDGLAEGEARGETKATISIIKSLLANTTFSEEEIAKLTNTTVEFVKTFC